MYKDIEKHRAYHREYRRKGRRDLLEKVGGSKCRSCGFSDWRALQIDHVFGGGVKEMSDPKNVHLKYSGTLLKHILSNPGKYQVLCANCNWIKVYENKESNWGPKKTKDERRSIKRAKIYRYCSMPKCPKVHLSHGMCAYHHQIWWRQTSKNSDRKPKN